MTLECILDEIALSQLSRKIPNSLQFKGYPQLLNDISKDPTLHVPPSNAPQPGYAGLIGSRSRDLNESQDSADFISSFTGQLQIDKEAAIRQPPIAAAKNFYQAFKRGLKRLGSLRRNNSA